MLNDNRQYVDIFITQSNTKYNYYKTHMHFDHFQIFLNFFNNLNVRYLNSLELK